MHGTHLAFQNLSKGGTVVNIASLAGLTPTAATPTYGASKAAIVAYTRYSIEYRWKTWVVAGS